MSNTEWWKGRFSDKDEAANEAHQTADPGKDKADKPLPDRVTYSVPPEVANRIRDNLRRRHTGSQQSQPDEPIPGEKPIPGAEPRQQAEPNGREEQDQLLAHSAVG